MPATRDARELGSAWRSFQQHRFVEPSTDLAPFVEHYWIVAWDYRQPYRQLIVPYPQVHLTFRGGGAQVHGVSRRHQVRLLEGRSGVFGVAFRPGCFRPFLGASVSSLTDRSVAVADVFGSAALPRRIDVESVENYLRALRPAQDPRVDEAGRAVATIVTNPAMMRVDDLANELGATVRQVQRLFAEYVGIGPKWVIRRYRLHEVTERLARGVAIDWAALAAELGYADQAHFVRDFRAMFGESPTWYAARY